MNGMKCVLCRETTSSEDDFRNQFTVSFSKLLTNFYVCQIIFKILPVNKT